MKSHLTIQIQILKLWWLQTIDILFKAAETYPSWLKKHESKMLQIWDPETHLLAIISLEIIRRMNLVNARI